MRRRAEVAAVRGKGRRPRRRTRAEIAPKGKLRILSLRETRRASGWRGAGYRRKGKRHLPHLDAVPGSDWTDRASEAVAAILFDAVEEVASDRELCARDPSRDFTRTRKISLEALIAGLVTMGQRAVGVEMHDAFGWNGAAPSTSAFHQQWRKLSDEAMPALLRALNGSSGPDHKDEAG